MEARPQRAAQGRPEGAPALGAVRAERAGHAAEHHRLVLPGRQVRRPRRRQRRELRHHQGSRLVDPDPALLDGLLDDRGPREEAVLDRRDRLDRDRRRPARLDPVARHAAHHDAAADRRRLVRREGSERRLPAAGDARRDLRVQGTAEGGLQVTRVAKHQEDRQAPATPRAQAPAARPARGRRRDAVNALAMTQPMVDRLFWRAGFGPDAADRAKWVGKPVADAVDWLLTTPGHAVRRVARRRTTASRSTRTATTPIWC